MLSYQRHYSRASERQTAATGETAEKARDMPIVAFFLYLFYLAGFYLASFHCIRWDNDQYSMSGLSLLLLLYLLALLFIMPWQCSIYPINENVTHFFIEHKCNVAFDISILIINTRGYTIRWMKQSAFNWNKQQHRSQRLHTTAQNHIYSLEREIA